MQKIIQTTKMDVADLQDQDKPIIFGMMMISFIGFVNLCGVIFMIHISS